MHTDQVHITQMQKKVHKRPGSELTRNVEWLAGLACKTLTVVRWKRGWLAYCCRWR
jgi:hypothetical protein